MSDGFNPRFAMWLTSIGAEPNAAGWQAAKLRHDIGTWDYMSFIGRVVARAKRQGIFSHQRKAFDRVCADLAMEETLRNFPA